MAQLYLLLFSTAASTTSKSAEFLADCHSNAAWNCHDIILNVTQKHRNNLVVRCSIKLSLDPFIGDQTEKSALNWPWRGFEGCHFFVIWVEWIRKSLFVQEVWCNDSSHDSVWWKCFHSTVQYWLNQKGTRYCHNFCHWKTKKNGYKWIELSRAVPCSGKEVLVTTRRELYHCTI